LQVIIPEQCLLNPSPEAAVVGGNVLTSQRVTDVVLKAFGAAAASQVGGAKLGNDDRAFRKGCMCWTCSVLYFTVNLCATVGCVTSLLFFFK
jgi:hypothetical protein